MILSNLTSPRYGNGLSIQSCFPENKSITNSSCKSSGEDDGSMGIVSDDDISLKDAFGPSILYHGNYELSFNAVSNIQNSHLQQAQAIFSSIDFPEAKGYNDHVVLNPSIWPVHAASSQRPSTAAEPNREEANDWEGFVHEMVPT